jgi:hypothetical protein
MNNHFLHLIRLWIVLAVLVGCTGPQGVQTAQPDLTTRLDAVIAPGDYDRILPNFTLVAESAFETLAPSIIGLHIDRNQQTVTFRLQDGAQLIAHLQLDTQAWGQGCQDNFSAVRMEIIQLAEPELALAGLTLQHPALIATCPSPPTVIVLRELTGDLESTLPAAACEYWAGETCLYFAQTLVILQGQVIDLETQQPVQGAEMVFSSPAGSQVFQGDYALSLPGGGLVDVTISAPGCQSIQGKIETTGERLILRLPTPSGAEQLAQAITIENPDQPIHWDFTLSCPK